MSRYIALCCAVLALLLLGRATIGCGGAPPSVSAVSIGIDLSTQTLVNRDGTVITPLAITGTYGPNCRVHKGEHWTLTLNNAADQSLEVALNDTFANCPLTLTGVRAQVGAMLPTYSIMPPIVLGLGYAAAPSKVVGPSPSATMPPPLMFYANARLGNLPDLFYGQNFTVSLVWSDDARVGTCTAPAATYTTVTAAATGSGVPPPAYQMNEDGMLLKVDANNVVQSGSSGNFILGDPGGVQLGEEWKVFENLTSCCSGLSFADIDLIYRTGAATATGGIAGPGNVAISWTNFDLQGKTLAQYRTVMVKHTDGSGVYAYEIFQITFPAPLP